MLLVDSNISELDVLYIQCVEEDVYLITLYFDKVVEESTSACEYS